jgi:hypothetical protein
MRFKKKKKKKKKKLITVPDRSSLTTMRLFKSPTPSDDRVHPFSTEFTLAHWVAGAFRGAGAHMAVDAFGSPWTLFTCKTKPKIPSANLPLPHTTQYDRAKDSTNGGKNRYFQ